MFLALAYAVTRFRFRGESLLSANRNSSDLSQASTHSFPQRTLAPSAQRLLRFTGANRGAQKYRTRKVVRSGSRPVQPLVGLPPHYAGSRDAGKRRYDANGAFILNDASASARTFAARSISPTPSSTCRTSDTRST